MTASSPAQGPSKRRSSGVAWDSIIPRYEGDVPRLYVEARVAGLTVSHYDRKTCHVFDALPEPGSALGVFRNVGSLIFYKDERRWEVRVCCDAGPVDLATAITYSLRVVRRFGRAPGHWTRGREFTHQVSQRTGKRIAWKGLAYQLDADDLLAAANQAEEVADLLELSSWMEALA
ncbi:hypothetical protein QI633_08215 [Nocardioides sp. QY071]|uniref:hypothetical protein n=1 Tax=Nocardioides sp. QY071 TaxID=3044187 RepID=UPI00249C53F8|nr:hypothetical protein [Nocardioides sp. QY071]WGY03737.1 hypothetical protein QI633_08215 [Nocardioides sp. QY071]